jgi:hypothetical protein
MRCPGDVGEVTRIRATLLIRVTRTAAAVIA